MKKWILKCSMPLLLLTGLFYPKPYEASAASGSVSINETNFPDQIFREYIQSEFDTNDDWELSDSELQNVTVISVYDKGITSLKGIEYFYALNWLDCEKNQLTSLDVSNNTALEWLDCERNQLTSLDVSGAIALKALECQNNQLPSLDVTENTALANLDCGINQLTSLDVSDNTALNWLYCFNNKLTSLDVSGAALKALECQNNQLPSLDVTKNTALERLDCCDNQLTSLDVSNNTALKWLDCFNNKLTSLDVSGAIALNALECQNNQLPSLDVTKNTALEWLDCERNQLTSLDVSNNTALDSLFCNGNQLTSLDLSNNRKLQALHCEGNKLFELNLINNTDCYLVFCDGNRLASLNLSEYSYAGSLWANKLLIYAPNNKFDLSKLSGEFDVSRATSWTNGTVNGTMLTIINPSAPVEYMYDVYGTGERYEKLRLCVDNVKPDLVITQQPTDVVAEYGECVNVKVKAIGKNPTYQWYYKNPTSTKFAKSSLTGDTYSVMMTDSKSGRQVYCVITDENGNTVTSNTVTLGGPVKITAQPTNASATIGSTVKTTVTATGVGLKYQWYYKNPTSTTFAKSSVTDATYSATMTESKSERQVYCVITDKNGNTVTSNTVTLGSSVKITAQPTNASATIGSAVKTTVTATGVGLKYQWYFKNPTSTTFVKSSVTDATYSATMTESKSERQVYCVITDKNGNTKKTNTVTLTSKVKITQQPKDVVGEFSTKVTTTVKATGNDLKYQWYVRDLNYKDWVKSSITTNEYSFVLNGSKYGRKVYCVITDKYGNEVTTRTVTFITPGFQVYYADEYRYNKKTFTFHANGALDLSAPYFDHNGAVIINGEVPYHGGDDSETVLKLKICSDADWKVSSSANYVIFEDIAGNPIDSGTKGASWLVVYLKEFLSDSTEPTRECTITIESDGEKREHTLVQENYTINDMSKSEYYNSKNITELLEKADSNEHPKEYDMLDQILSGERITNGIIEYYRISGYYYIAISSRFTPSIPVGNIEIDYILFSINPNTLENDIIYRVEVCDAAGLRIEQGNDPLFTCNCPILSNVTNVTDKTYEKKFEKANDSLDIIEFAVDWKAGVLFPKASPLASAIVGSTLDTLMGKLLEVRMEKIPNNSHNGNVSTTTYSIKEGCVLSEVGDCVQILCRKNEAVYPEIIASFNFVGPNNNIQQFVNSYTAE